jgi:hypothetical protein
MVLRLAEHLDVPARERNSLLPEAGYVPRFTGTALGDPAMDTPRETLDRLPRGYEPYPAPIVDATCTVVSADRGVAHGRSGDHGRSGCSGAWSPPRRRPGGAARWWGLSWRVGPGSQLCSRSRSQARTAWSSASCGLCFP